MSSLWQCMWHIGAYLPAAGINVLGRRLSNRRAKEHWLEHWRISLRWLLWIDTVYMNHMIAWILCFRPQHLAVWLFGINETMTTRRCIVSSYAIRSIESARRTWQVWELKVGRDVVDLNLILISFAECFQDFILLLYTLDSYWAPRINVWASEPMAGDAYSRTKHSGKIIQNSNEFISKRSLDTK